MLGESKHVDYKITFEHKSERAKLELVRHIVAISNSGGGSIVFGHDESKPIGVDKKIVEAVDSSRVSAWVNSYVKPANIDLSHNTEEISPNLYLVTLNIPAAEYPLVLFKRGFWKGADTRTDRPVFEKGDVLFRHNTSSEKLIYDDLKQWIDEVRKEERSSILDRLTTFVNLPQGTTIEVVDESGSPIDSPKRLLRSVRRRRNRDPDHLISANDLLWVFLNRHNTLFDSDDLRVLIAGSLRRNPTLFYWLSIAEADLDVIVDEINGVITASDRDKSDAAKNLIEITSVYLNEQELRKVLKALRESRYSHFKEEAKAWNSREEVQRGLARRINSAKVDGAKLIDQSIDDLESQATEYASMLLSSKSVSWSRRLSDCTRVVWAKKSKYADFVRE